MDAKSKLKRADVEDELLVSRNFHLVDPESADDEWEQRRTESETATDGLAGSVGIGAQPRRV